LAVFAFVTHTLHLLTSNREADGLHQVVSPFQAILDYETSKGIPPGWINHSISASGPTGAWQRLERGDILLDQHFFRAFAADLRDEKRWRAYYARHLAQTRQQTLSDAAGRGDMPASPVVQIR